MKKPEFTYRKHGGDDMYSWAVFRKGRDVPVLSGLSRSEAQYYKQQLEKENQPH